MRFCTELDLLIIVPGLKQKRIDKNNLFSGYQCSDVLPDQPGQEEERHPVRDHDHGEEILGRQLASCERSYGSACNE